MRKPWTDTAISCRHTACDPRCRHLPVRDAERPLYRCCLYSGRPFFQGAAPSVRLVRGGMAITMAMAGAGA